MKKEELKKLRESTRELAAKVAVNYNSWRKEIKKAEELVEELCRLKPSSPTAEAVCTAIHTASIKEEECKFYYERWLEKAKRYEIEMARIEKRKSSKL